MWMFYACTGAAGPDTATAVAEADDDAATVTSLSGASSSTLAGDTDVDWWSVVVEEPAFLRVQVVQDATSPVQVRAYDDAGAAIAERALREGDLLAWIPEPRTVLLTVTRRDGVAVPAGGAPYTLTPSTEPPTPEPDDASTAASAIPDRGVLLETEEDADYVALEAGYYTIGVSGAIQDGFSGWMSVALSDGTAYGAGSYLRMPVTQAAVLRVEALAGFEGTWNVLHVSSVADSYAVETEPNDVTAEVFDSDRVYGTIGVEGDVDLYATPYTDASAVVATLRTEGTLLEGAAAEVTEEDGVVSVRVTGTGGYGAGGWYVLEVATL